MKIRAKFSLSAIILVIVVVFGVSVLLFMAQRNLLLKEMRENQVAALKGLVHASKEFLITKNRIQLINYINQLRETRALLFAELMDNGGCILAHTDIALLERIDSTPQAVKARESRDFFVQTYLNQNGEEVSDFSLPVIADDRKAATARLSFSQTQLDKIIEKTLEKTGRLILGVAAVALVMGIIGAVILSQMMTDPIKKMARGAALIGQGNLDTVINVKSKDELGSLAEDLNLMAAKLKELDQMKQDFVSSVTHELRSPLNSLGMYFDLFFKGQLGDVSEQQKEALSFMKDSTVRLTKFISDLLDTAKIERGKMEILPRRSRLEPIVNDAVRLYKVQADDKKIELRAVVPQELPDIHADPDRTAQVLNNLINNALKFTPKGGKVTVSASRESQFVRISVADTGMGIPKDQLGTVFNKFEQVKGIRNQVKGPKGTGLGLAIVKGLVEAQGGKIWVESEQGKGTVFYFTLPVDKGEPEN